MSSVTSGTRLGSYEILAPIGAGGMGEVYRATDRRLGRTVAIKIISDKHQPTPEVRERFEREARAISSLNHPNICALYDLGHEAGIDYLVMEYLEGETLEGRLNRGSLPLGLLVQTAIEVSGALEAAHRTGLVHRDLKPSNILLTRSGSKLLDFGLAKFASGANASASMGASNIPTDPKLTSPGLVMGTLQYMSPEQIEGQEADARSDLFALGVVMYEMATGRKPFSGKSQASLMAAILQFNPPPISELQPLIPSQLEGIVRGCLAKDPADRCNRPTTWCFS